VFFQMLTGKVPYERETTLATMFAHVNDPPPALEPPIVDEYPEFTPVVQRAMAKKPDERYLSAGDLARDAAAALGGARYQGAPRMVATGEARPSPAEPADGSSLEAAGAAAATASASDITIISPGANVGERQPTPPPLQGEKVPEEPAAPDQGHGGGRLRRYWWAIAALVVGVAAAVVAVVVLTSGSGATGPGQLFQAVLRPVPHNHVTGSGTAAVTLHGDVATITVDTTGLANASHPMHLHAFGLGICPPASAAKRYNGHLAISTTDGLKYYGPMAAALTLSGDTSMNSMLAFTRYPTTGDIQYRRTMTLATATANAIRNGNAVVVVHGIDYDHSGHYDNALNKSELDSAVSQDATAPALCGTLLNPASVGESG
jgi:hypothetical protein